MDPFQSLLVFDGSQKVQGVFDRISQQVITQGTSSKRPTWSSTGLNGLPCLVLSGGQSLKLPFPVTGPLTGTQKPFSMTFVAQCTNATSGLTANGTMVSFGSSTNTVGPEAAVNQDTSGNFNAFRFDDTGSGPDNFQVAGDTKAHVFTAVFSGGNLSLRLDGAAVTPLSQTQGASTGTMTVNQIVIGDDPDGAVAGFGDDFFTGKMGQVAIYGGGIVNLEVEKFFKSYYGL